MKKVSLHEQATAVERACMNLRAMIHRREEINEEKGREVWPQSEIDMRKSHLVDLEAAAVTLTWLVNNEAAVREAHRMLKAQEKAA